MTLRHALYALLVPGLLLVAPPRRAWCQEERARPPASDPEHPPLPAVECVEAVRRSRIAREAADLVTARREIDAALQLPGCAMPALAAALPMLRAGAYSPDEVAALSGRLSALLADPTTRLPEGLLGYLVSVPARREDEQSLLDALVRRLERSESESAAYRPPTTELAEVLDVVADLHQRHGRAAEARAVLHRLLAVAPDEVLRWRVVLLDLQLGEWHSAAGLLAGMVDVPEAPQHLRELYVVALANLGRHDEMLRQLERLTPTAAAGAAGAREVADGEGVPSRYAGVALAAAWALRDAGRDPEAEATFRRVLALDPENEEARLALLHLYGTAEERAAHAAALAARQQSETDPVALFEQGSDLLGAGDLEAASGLLARAAPQLAGTDYEEAAWFNLGTALFRLERWTGALDALDRAIAVNAGRAESHYRRGIALYRLERFRDAVDALDLTLRLDAAKRDAHAFLALAHAKLGDEAAAARHRALSGQ